jgi:DNA-binding XRE family transcriptional regulator
VKGRSKRLAEVLKHIGANIHRGRVRRALTQSGLAEMVDLETRSIARIEHGDIAPSVATVVQIADALDVPVASLFKPSAPFVSKRGRPKKGRSQPSRPRARS